MVKLLCVTGVVCLTLTSAAWSQQSAIAPGIDGVSVEIGGGTISITRGGAACPPSCIQPLQPAPGIATLAELEVIAFLEEEVAAGRGLLVDLRAAESFAAMTLPGAVNVPAETLAPENPYRDDLLAALGIGEGASEDAFTLVLFGEDAAATAVTRALRALIEAGYPTDRLRYYRGGIAAWTSLGLSTAPGA